MKKIGLLSFVPDAGHILPLLRIAQTFAENGFEIVCFFPEEGVKHAAGFGFSAISIGKVTENTRSNVFDRVSRMSILFCSNGGGCILERDYIFPIREYIDKNFFRITGLVGEQELSMLVADIHVFEKHYIKLAQSIKVPLITHHSEGNLRYLQNTEVRSFGLNWCHPWIQPLFPVARIPLLLMSRVITRIILGKVSYAGPSVNSSSIQISSGLGIVEKGLQEISSQQKARKVLHFAPVVDKRSGRINPRTEKWLNQRSEKPVVYISLGTLVRASEGLLVSVLRGLKVLDTKILMVLTQEQKNILEKSGIVFDENMLVEDYLPQAEILNHPRVTCSINHGGAGTVQECLLAGKPMLCIPFTSDQPYNSSIVSLLRAGIRLDKHRVTPERIRAAVDTILSSPSFAESAQKVRDQFTRSEGGKAIFEFARSEIL